MLIVLRLAGLSDDLFLVYYPNILEITVLLQEQEEY